MPRFTRATLDPNVVHSSKSCHLPPCSYNFQYEVSRIKLAFRQSIGVIRSLHSYFLYATFYTIFLYSIKTYDVIGYNLQSMCTEPVVCMYTEHGSK